MPSAVICWIWGHAVDNRDFAQRDRHCQRCGRPLLRDDGSVVRIGHTLSCFFRHHTYAPTGERDGHDEYACVRCGHPLVMAAGEDRYRDKPLFDKRVRYLCGLLGHRVHVVTVRNGGIEYACRCGHSFVRRRPGRVVVRHPLACFLLGHWVSFVARRARHSEYACRRCGHPFLFALRVE